MPASSTPCLNAAPTSPPPPASRYRSITCRRSLNCSVETGRLLTSWASEPAWQAWRPTRSRASSVRARAGGQVFFWPPKTCTSWRAVLGSYPPHLHHQPAHHRDGGGQDQLSQTSASAIEYLRRPWQCTKTTDEAGSRRCCRVRPCISRLPSACTGLRPRCPQGLDIIARKRPAPLSAIAVLAELRHRPFETVQDRPGEGINSMTA